VKSFEYIADIWLKSELFGKQYSYRKGLEKDVEHLVAYFGNRNCEDIKGMDVDRFIQYESEHLNPNTGKPFSKRLMKAHLSAGLDALRASKLMGHSNVQITLDIYTHLEQKYKTIDITPFL